MRNWRDVLLRHLLPPVERLTLASDPHGLLKEEKLIRELLSAGYDEILWFEEPISFRYLYESRFRSKWDRGESVHLLVAFSDTDFEMLPYDLLQIGKRVFLHLSEIFPGLDSSVICHLDPASFDALFEAVNLYRPNGLGENATKDFVLRHVYGIAYEIIKTPVDLLRMLIRQHYSGRSIPPIFGDYLVEQLRRNERFKDWPLEQIVRSRVDFFTFLQERWPVFLEYLANRRKLDEVGGKYDFKVPGPCLLLFEHDDIRVYMDNLFLEGILRPVYFDKPVGPPYSWVNVGIILQDRKDRDTITVIERMLERLNRKAITTESSFEDWKDYARLYAELVFVTIEHDVLNSDKKFEEILPSIQRDIDEKFIPWMLKHYRSLASLPGLVMVHHIPRFLSKEISKDDKKKMALVVIDGLSLDQWLAIKHELYKQNASWHFEEDVLFAWVPTITSVSRQAIFSGNPPWFFSDTIYSTAKEPNLWYKYWSDKWSGKFSKREVAFVGNAERELDKIVEHSENPSVRVLAIVVGMVDKIMHGMKLGIKGMHNQVRQWVREGFINRLLEILWKNNFSIFLSSDHGNIESVGFGRPREGTLPEELGKRVVVFSSPDIREKVKEKLPDAIEWPSIGLPSDCYPLLAPKRKAFANKNEKVVCHGGIALEEVLVPFIRVYRN